MEPVYLELVLNDRLIRINKNDSMELYIWRDWRIKTPKWKKRKPVIYICKKTGYKSYRIQINFKMYLLSRLVFKVHNNDWDITDTSKNNFIDHINNNSIDNRIENLRILTHQQNQFNTNAKGYTWDKQTNKWRAGITLNGKQINLGRFTEEADARNAYLEAKSLYHHIA